MQIIIQSPHVTPTEALTKFIKNKIGNLSHFYDKDAVTKVIDAMHVEIDKMKTRFQHQQ